MDEATIVSIGREAVITVLVVAAPLLGLALAVGLLVSIFQATTQIQEQTLSFVPKIVAVLGALIVFGPWMTQILTDFTIRLLSNMHTYVR